MDGFLEWGVGRKRYFLGKLTERSRADMNPSICHLRWTWNRECRIKGQIIELYICPTNLRFACFMADLQQGEISEAKQYFAIEQYHGITIQENSRWCVFLKNLNVLHRWKNTFFFHCSRLVDFHCCFYFCFGRQRSSYHALYTFAVQCPFWT